jgi:hypothetical protein
MTVPSPSVNRKRLPYYRSVVLVRRRPVAFVRFYARQLFSKITFNARDRFTRNNGSRPTATTVLTVFAVTTVTPQRRVSCDDVNDFRNPIGFDWFFRGRRRPTHSRLFAEKKTICDERSRQVLCLFVLFIVLSRLRPAVRFLVDYRNRVVRPPETVVVRGYDIWRPRNPPPTGVLDVWFTMVVGLGRGLGGHSWLLTWRCLSRFRGAADESAKKDWRVAKTDRSGYRLRKRYRTRRRQIGDDAPPHPQ